MKQFRNICLAAIVTIFTGCGKPVVHTTSSDEPVLAAVRANVDALNRQDLAGAMASMHPQSPGLEQTRKMSEQIFQQYKLRLTLKELAVESIKEDEARVRFVQITEKLSGPAFRNNRLEGIHTLKKSNGEWKLYATEASKIDYLDK